jgi:S1-C subfamily serine protease
MKNSVAIVVCAAFLSGCASVFMLKKQKVTINTGVENATVYVDNEEFGTGSSIKGKLKKTGTKQIIVKAKDYKDNYVALTPSYRPWGFWVCQVFNLPFDSFFLIPTLWDTWNNKTLNYSKVNQLPAPIKLVNRTADDKYIDVSAIKLKIKDKDKDIYVFSMKYSKSGMEEKMEKLEKEKEADEVKAQLALEKSKKKAKILIDETDNNKIVSDDSRFSDDIYKTLKSTGFIDTVNKVFSDNNNTLLLEAALKKVYFYSIITKDQEGGNISKAKVFLTWYIKNTYGEVLDSVDTKQLSGDFIRSMDKEALGAMCSDAINISYLRLYDDVRMKKHIRQSSKLDLTEPMLTLSAPKAAITEKSMAFDASVIVKTDKGHGSGFAITNDGYIVTNYHVVAGRITDKPYSIKVLTSSGDELSGKLIRYNKFRDLALIKVDKTFNKAFRVSSTKSFKNMQTVYSVGAPKSIELGQSISSGVISNERKTNNNNLLQLGMSVNGGNSGGPLFDDAGNLQGVIVSKLVGQNTEGISFAVPGYLLEDYLKINFK